MRISLRVAAPMGAGLALLCTVLLGAQYFPSRIRPRAVADPAGRWLRLANISTRGFVLTENDVMIGGFILGGGNHTNIVTRGIGPSLAQIGISPALADPTLGLHDFNGALLVANNNWQDDPDTAAQLTANGLALSDPNESGIFIALQSGLYTAILAGNNGGTGIGLVEIYNLQ